MGAAWPCGSRTESLVCHWTTQIKFDGLLCVCSLYGTNNSPTLLAVRVLVIASIRWCMIFIDFIVNHALCICWYVVEFTRILIFSRVTHSHNCTQFDGNLWAHAPEADHVFRNCALSSAGPSKPRHPTSCDLGSVRPWLSQLKKKLSDKDRVRMALAKKNKKNAMVIKKIDRRGRKSVQPG